MDKARHLTVRLLLPCIMIALCAVAAATVFAAEDKHTDGHGPAVVKWQHLALTHDVKTGVPRELARQINKLGRDGWQLVTVENTCNAGTTTKTVFYFKKPL